MGSLPQTEPLCRRLCVREGIRTVVIRLSDSEEYWGRVRLEVNVDFDLLRQDASIQFWPAADTNNTASVKIRMSDNFVRETYDPDSGRSDRHYTLHI